MKKELRYIVGTIAALVLSSAPCVESSAQQDPSFTHFWMVETEFNPAAAGNSELLRGIGVYNAQLAGYKNSPKTMLISADMPLFFVGPQHGVGAYFMSDDAGFFSLKNFAVQYAHHRKLFSGTLSVGLQVDLLNQSFDGGKLNLEDSDD